MSLLIIHSPFISDKGFCSFTGHTPLRFTATIGLLRSFIATNRSLQATLIEESSIRDVSFKEPGDPSNGFTSSDSINYNSVHRSRRRHVLSFITFLFCILSPSLLDHSPIGKLSFAMCGIVSFLAAMGLAGLVAAVPSPGSGEHLWHRRNVTSNALPTGSGTPVATGASIQGTLAPTGGFGAGKFSAVKPIYSRAKRETDDSSGSSTGLQGATHCGQYEATQTGNYNIQNLLWGEAEATSGSQCYGVDGLNGNTVSWHSVYSLVFNLFFVLEPSLIRSLSSWTWAGNEYNVKSYSNANLIFSPKQLSAVTSIPSTWSYTQTGSDFRADVSYDMFLADSTDNAANVAYVGDARSYEIMIWLAAIQIGPISSTGDTPLTSTTIGGINWKLYKGPNGSTTVFSFVADPQITDYSGDLYDFYKYLMTEQGVSGDQYLAYIGAGTEPF